MKIAIVKGGFEGIQAQLRAWRCEQEAKEAGEAAIRMRKRAAATEQRAMRLRNEAKELEEQAKYYQVRKDV